MIKNSQFYLKSQWSLLCVIIHIFFSVCVHVRVHVHVLEMGFFFSKDFLLKTICSKGLCLRVIKPRVCMYFGEL